MSTMKKGVLVRCDDWAVHLRPYGKRKFWHRHRKAEAALPRLEAAADEESAAIEAYDDFLEELWREHEQRS